MAEELYFYLDEDNKPQGPCSHAELTALLQAGKISPATMIAKEGDAVWKPFGTVFVQAGGAAAGAGSKLPPMPSKPFCPSCQKELTLTPEGELPADCPHCGRSLRPRRKGMWGNVALMFRQSFKISGRATRAECWYSYLFCFLLFLLSLLLLILLWCCGSDACVYLAFLLGGGLFVLVFVLVQVPLLTQFCRRLHDVGFSSKWLLLNYVLCAVSFSLTFWILSDVFFASLVDLTEPEMLMAECRAEENLEDATVPDSAAGDSAAVKELLGEEQDSEEAIMKGYLSRVEKKLQEYPLSCFLLQMGRLGSNILGLFFFVCLFLDSKRGNNKYGPSAKYPLG